MFFFFFEVIEKRKTYRRTLQQAQHIITPKHGIERRAPRQGQKNTKSTAYFPVAHPLPQIFVRRIVLSPRWFCVLHLPLHMLELHALEAEPLSEEVRTGLIPLLSQMLPAKTLKESLRQACSFLP